MSEDSGNNAPTNEGGEQNNASFMDSVAEEHRGFVENKGFKDVNGVIQSYQNAEKMLGGPAESMMRLPQQGDTEGMRAIQTKLGLPEKPDGYELITSENLPVDDNFQSWFKNTSHELGLTAEQAKGLSGKYNEFVEGGFAADQSSYETDVASQKEALQTEWGSGFAKQMQLAENAAEGLGFTADEVDALEGAIGYDGVMKRMAALGKMMGEDNFVTNENNGGGDFKHNMTPAEAESAYSTWIADKNNTTALFDKQHVNHKAAMAKKEQFFKLRFPAKS